MDSGSQLARVEAPQLPSKSTLEPPGVPNMKRIPTKIGMDSGSQLARVEAEAPQLPSNSVLEPPGVPKMKTIPKKIKPTPPETAPAERNLTIAAARTTILERAKEPVNRKRAKEPGDDENTIAYDDKDTDDGILGDGTDEVEKCHIHRKKIKIAEEGAEADQGCNHLCLRKGEETISQKGRGGGVTARKARQNGWRAEC
jgi:hypothetical protein